MAKPELKQFGELSAADFDRHPVWVGCHGSDYGEPWYEDTDEETFRPWTGALPVSPADGMLLVRATVELPDGTRHQGFITPALEAGDLGTLQPELFVGQRRFSFWGGMLGVAVEERQALYAALKRSSPATFPLRFSADPSLATGVITGQVDGFYQHQQSQIHVEY